ncbi:hypothetical protein NSPZN2_130024 [Nitrospira defluvii]|uniref:Uncharacterized protein n=1 Tax=Nitrospira defluvii TaxID=330214 RepID=A0ABM8R8T7_9BACT|nr:hypothetical protein NSPZN2_130024 [Nitrospira defluvii]
MLLRHLSGVSGLNQTDLEYNQARERDEPSAEKTRDLTCSFHHASPPSRLYVPIVTIIRLIVTIRGRPRSSPFSTSLFSPTSEPRGFTAVVPLVSSANPPNHVRLHQGFGGHPLRIPPRLHSRGFPHG